MNAAGDWTLSAVDSVGADVGAINGWSLHFTVAAAGNDCNGNGVPDECDEDCNENGTPDECEFQDLVTNYAIPVSPAQPISNTLPPATHTFDVAAAGPVLDVNVDVSLSHTWSSDLEIRVSHEATTVLLFDNQCGSEDNFNGTVFDDEAAGPIACAAGHVGTFRPFQPLSAFDGLEASGDWTISVTDNVGGDSGALTAWSLRIVTPPQGDCNGNGTPDECELDGNDCNNNGVPDDCDEDCNGNGTPDDCEDITPPTEKLYEATPNVAIPNNNPAGVSTTLNVPDHGLIGDLNVWLYIDHQEQGDLRVTLSHNNVPVLLINRAGSNASGCGNSIYGYPADDYGSMGSPLVLDDSASVGIDCYDGGPLTPEITGEFNYAGPASPSQALSTYNSMDKFGDWTLTVSDHLFYNSGTLVYWALDFVNQGQGDCNENGIPDECDIASGESTDGNNNGIPDECEFVREAQVVSAVSRKACELGLMPRSSEPRIGGVDFVDVEFDTEIDGCDMALEWAPCSGGDYAPYTGSSTMSCFTVGEHLYVNFSPGLEDHQRYRISFGEGTTVIPDQSVEFRTLLGDVNQDGTVDAIDRSMVVGIWTGSGFSCQTDINDDSLTNAVDRSSVVGVWTGGANACPWE
jgi:subtilisin-like proprotein convertase family protein